MMAEKARLFGDEHALLNIMRTDNPRMHKQLGRSVQGYDEVEWNRARTTIVTRATYAKFKQNLHMGRHLLDTREKVRVCRTVVSWWRYRASRDMRESLPPLARVPSDWC